MAGAHDPPPAVAKRSRLAQADRGGRRLCRVLRSEAVVDALSAACSDAGSFGPEGPTGPARRRPSHPRRPNGRGARRSLSARAVETVRESSRSCCRKRALLTRAGREPFRTSSGTLSVITRADRRAIDPPAPQRGSRYLLAWTPATAVVRAWTFPRPHPRPPSPPPVAGRRPASPPDVSIHPETKRVPPCIRHPP